MLQITLAKYRDIKQFLDLFRATFSQKCPQTCGNGSISRIRSQADPEIAVALNEGKLVGARPFLLAEMWARLTSVSGIRGTELV